MVSNSCLLVADLKTSLADCGPRSTFDQAPHGTSLREMMMKEDLDEQLIAHQLLIELLA